MRRQDKYPDTATFHYHNENPRNKITGDCVVRAIATATGFTYESVVMDLAELQAKTGYSGVTPDGYGRYLEQLGWIKHKQPRKWDNTKYTGEEFCKELLRYDSEIDSGNNMHRLIANIGGGHVVAIIEGQVYDTWDSTDGCIGNYWTL